MAQFEIRPMEMEQTAREIDAKINEWQASVNRLYQYVSELDTMWEGDANDAFNKTFAADRSKYNSLANLMDEYKNAILKAAQEYKIADSESAKKISNT
ncbi:MAG: WXG100 family type VII secretion target [Ruminococcus sp.]|nr:WXG100 family type VII secretion target [Ruminococcus sp.]